MYTEEEKANISLLIHERRFDELISLIERLLEKDDKSDPFDYINKELIVSESVDLIAFFDFLEGYAIS